MLLCLISFVSFLITSLLRENLNKIQEENSSSSDEEGGSIFDSIMSTPYNSKKNKSPTEKVSKIEVDKEMLLNIISDYYSNKGFVFLALVLAYENKDIMVSKATAESLSKNLIVEIVKGTKSDSEESFDKIISAIDELEKRFNLDKEEFFIFVRNQYRYLENLKLEFKFIKANKNSSLIMFRLEEELIKSLDFINVMTSYPFAIDLERDQNSLRSIITLIDYLDNVVEWMFIYETESIEEEKSSFINSEDDKDESDNISTQNN